MVECLRVVTLNLSLLHEIPRPQVRDFVRSMYCNYMNPWYILYLDFFHESSKNKNSIFLHLTALGSLLPHLLGAFCVQESRLHDGPAQYQYTKKKSLLFRSDLLKSSYALVLVAESVSKRYLHANLGLVMGGCPPLAPILPQYLVGSL